MLGMVRWLQPKCDGQKSEIVQDSEALCLMRASSMGWFMAESVAVVNFSWIDVAKKRDRCKRI